MSWFEAPVDPKSDQWREHVIDKNVEYIHTLKVTDMDNDGASDVVAAEMHQSTDPDNVVYRNEGHARTWRKQILAHTGSHNLCG